MNVAELRIGSHYHYEGSEIKLDGSTLACYLNNELKSPLYSVLLTEKWLLDFGFKKIVYDSEETGYGTEYDLVTDDFTLSYSDDFSLSISYTKDLLAIIPNIDLFKYVHQLQNLYFSLKGEELIKN